MQWPTAGIGYFRLRQAQLSIESPSPPQGLGRQLVTFLKLPLLLGPLMLYNDVQHSLQKYEPRGPETAIVDQKLIYRH